MKSQTWRRRLSARGPARAAPSASTKHSSPSALQVYVSEIAGPDIRGCLSAVLKMVGQVGVLLSFLGGAYLDWRQLAMVVAVAPVMLFVSVLYVPETPSYLVLAGKDDEAARALQWLRGPDADVGPELAVIRSNILCMDDAPPRSPASFVAAGHRLLRPALTTCGLMLFQRFSGAQAFQFYAVPIFRQTFGGMSPHGGAIAVAFVQLLASLLSGLLIDTVGRLPLLIASSVFMSMALAGFGSFAYYMDAQVSLRQAGSKVLQKALQVVECTRRRGGDRERLANRG